MSALSIDLPDSLHNKLRDFAVAEGTSVERLITSAAAEKVSAMMKGADFLRREAKLASRGEFDRVLAKAPEVAPEPHDSLD